MNFKTLTSIPILLGGLVAYIPHMHNVHTTVVAPIPPKSYQMSYAKYLQDMQVSHNLKSVSSNSKPALLGYGYDITNGTFSKINAFQDMNHTDVKIIPLNSTYNYAAISDESSLTSNLGVDGSVRFGFKHFAISGAAKFKKDLDENTATFKISFRMKTDVIELFDPQHSAKLSNNAKALLDNNLTSSFFNLYDDKFAIKLFATREVVFNLDIHTSNYKDTEAITGKIGFSKGLLSLAGALTYAKEHSGNSAKIEMNTLTLPGNEVLAPENGVPSINSDSAADRNKFLANMQRKAIDYVNLSDAKKSNPINYFAKGIKENQLASYSMYYDKSAKIPPIINPGIDILKEFPTLNQYYDLYENMAQDLKKLNSFGKITKNSPNFLILFPSYVKKLNDSLSYDNANFRKIFSNHDAKPLEEEWTHYQKLLFQQNDFSDKLRGLDWLFHTNVMQMMPVPWAPKYQPIINMPTHYNECIINIKSWSEDHSFIIDVRPLNRLVVNREAIINISFAHTDLYYDGSILTNTILPNSLIITNDRIDPWNPEGFSTDFHSADFEMLNTKNIWVHNKKMHIHTGYPDKIIYTLSINSTFDSAFNPDEIFFHPTEESNVLPSDNLNIN